MILLELDHGIEFYCKALNLRNRLLFGMHLSGVVTLDSTPITGKLEVPLNGKVVVKNTDWVTEDITSLLVLGGVRKSHKFPFLESLDAR